MSTSTKRYNLSQMSEDAIEKLMNSVIDDENSEDDHSADEDAFDSDDSVEDPDFKISDEDFEGIDNYIDHLESSSAIDLLSSAINFSINEGNESTGIIPQNNTNIEAEPSCSKTTDSKRPTKTKPRKPNKRARSPLPELEEGEAAIEPNSGGFSGSVKDCIPQSPEFKNILWKKKSLELHRNEVIFRGERKLPQSFNDLNTPYKCFMYFFTNELLEDIAHQTNLYAHQENVNFLGSITSTDLKKYIGILLYMSVFRYPNVESYWSKHALECVRSTMPIKRFYAIRKNLHFNDSSSMPKKGEKGYDQLYKVRPVINKLNERFNSVPKTPRLCVDEQMCSTKMMTALRQYMPDKPHKYGIKLFVLCDTYGFAYQFEVYRGAGDNEVIPNAPDLGATGNVVLRLSQTVPNFKNHVIYFDNFYTSLSLLVYLRSRGIYALGTVRANRVPNCKLSKDEDIKSKERGYSEEYVGSAFGLDISCVLWKDTKCVRLVSTYAGVKPFRTSNEISQPLKTTRFDRKKKNYVEIYCPNIVKEYNHHMGGVDLMDSLLGRYHIRMKTRKWTCRLFYHMVDMAVVNAYILYHRINNSDSKYNLHLKLPSFRTEVADVLCYYEIEKNKVGRPSTLSPQVRSTYRRTYAPPADIRYDGIGHMPDCLQRSGKRMCKLEGCKSETQIFCTKCKLNLCLSSTKKCFQLYHSKSSV